MSFNFIDISKTITVLSNAFFFKSDITALTYACSCADQEKQGKRTASLCF